jgi:hypothetical protein
MSNTPATPKQFTPATSKQCTPATLKQCTPATLKQETSKKEMFVVVKNYSLMKRYEYADGNTNWRYLS